MVVFGGALFVVVFSSAAHAQWTTVCDTCPYTDIQAAINAAPGTGDVIEVQNPLTRAVSSDININKNVHVTCLNGTDIIDNVDDINISAASAQFTNCTVEDVDQVVITAGSTIVDNVTFDNTSASCTTTDPYVIDVQGSIDVQLSDNTFQYYPKVIDYADSYTSEFDISGNNILNACANDSLINLAGTGLVDGNSFDDVVSPDGSDQIMIDVEVDTATPRGNLLVQNNSLLTLEESNSVDAIWVSNPTKNVNIEVAGNTMGYDPDSTHGDKMQSGIVLNVCGGGSNTCVVKSNRFVNSIDGITIMDDLENAQIIQNSFWGDDDSALLRGIRIYGGSTDLDEVDIKYNIIQNYDYGIYTDSGISSITNYDFDYNVYWDINTDAVDGTVETPGTNSRGDFLPGFGDPNTYQFDLAGCSQAIGFCAADGCSGGDAGAEDYSGSRVTPITVDANTGNTAHFRDIQEAIDASDSGDTITVAAGTYDSGSVAVNDNAGTTEYALMKDLGENYLDGYETGAAIGGDNGYGKTVNIVGAGSGSVIVEASGVDYGLYSQQDGISISGMTIRNATTANIFQENAVGGSTFSDLILSRDSLLSYAISSHPYSFGGNDYIGESGSEGMFLLHDDSGSDDFALIQANGAGGEDTVEITQYINSGSPQNWHLLLMQAGGEYYTIIADDTEFDTPADVEDFLGFSAECYKEDFYVATAGSYADGDATTGTTTCGTATLVDGTDYADSAHIDDASASTVGMELYGSSNTLSNISFSNLIKGLVFSSTADSNAVPANNSVSFSGTTTDISQNSTGTNTVDGCETDYSFEELQGTLSFSGVCGGAASVPEFDEWVYLLMVVAGIGVILLFYRNFGRKMGTA